MKRGRSGFHAFIMKTLTFATVFPLSVRSGIPDSRFHRDWLHLFTANMERSCVFPARVLDFIRCGSGENPVCTVTCQNESG